MSDIVYTRISEDRTGEELGVTRQREDCLDLAKRRGLRVTKILQDNDKSAAGKVERPGFEQLLKLVDAGQVKVIVAWNLDRLTRNRRDTLRLIEVCERREVTIALVRGSDMDLATPAGRLSADILAGVARHEIDQKSDRQRRAIAQAVEQGRRVGGRRPFGYELDMTPRADETAAVRWAYKALLAGASLGAIAREWNNRGLTTPQGHRKDRAAAPWSGQTVSRALRKPAYAGIRSHKGVEQGPAAWQGLVKETTWRAAQDVLDDPSRKHQGGPRALLTGIALCGVDGCGLTVHSGGGYTNRNYRVYRCRSMKHIARRAEPIDAFIAGGEIDGEHVDGVIVDRVRRDDARELLAKRSRPDVADLHAEADRLRRRLEVLAGDLDIDEQTLARRDRALRARLGEVQTKLAEAGRTDVLAPLITAGDVARAWQTYDLDTRRLIVAKLIIVTILPVKRGTRTFRPDSVRVEWRS